MNKAFNPFLPLDKYIPDGEPHVFNDRIYLFGSHDEENGDTYCKLGYEIFSAPINDLSNWTSKGINYEAKQDPLYSNDNQYMYAPDCVKGNDGKYYLYYCLSGYKGRGGYKNPISVAVSDSPDGKYQYYGYVRNEDGTPFLDKLCFDPAIINDDGIIRLYFGSDYPWLDIIPFKRFKRKAISKIVGIDIKKVSDDYSGAFHVVLNDDMLTIKSKVSCIIPFKNDEYKKHQFFEGSSIRKINNKYYFIYSSTNNHELCYAISDYPDRDFEYKGTIVSNGDIGYKGRKDADRLNHTGTNHGSIEQINNKWYVFYHRLTHNSDYSRQACAEKINILEDGSIPQVEITSFGLSDDYLNEGKYKAVICCNLTNGHMSHGSNSINKTIEPCVYSHNNERFITDISNNTFINYKYFRLKGEIKINVSIKGDPGRFEIYLNDELKGIINNKKDDDWNNYDVLIDIEDNIYKLGFKYCGKGKIDFKEFIIEEIKGEDNV